ncbi:hypothetical protein LTR86_006413 [Recurvomyces mirabilis]|nr:hypothetical protein LTR86_006413 [Recurvomyces mirabilis]
MDALTGLGAVSAIVQLIQFSCSVARSARNIHRNFTNASEKKPLVAESLLKELALFDKYASGLRTFMSAEELDASVAAAAEPLLDCCLRVKGDCGKLLDRLQIQGGTGKLERLRAAIRVEKGTNAMLELQKELRSLQTRVLEFMMFILAERQSSHYKMVEARHQQNAKFENELMARVSALRDMVKDMTVTQKDEALMVQQVLCDLKTFASEAQECLYVRRVLLSLRYESMDAREAAIVDSHSDTFRWLLDPDKTEASSGQVSIVEWLCSGSGLYWISGKAGAGKSTLMKMLCDDDRTVSLLSQWAGGQRMVRASHFFWVAGSTMQKNQLGLLQALCFGILEQHPSLLPVVCREELEATRANAGEILAPWELPRLKTLLQQIVTQGLLPNPESVRFCFFIDGLDEYEGELHHSELAQYLLALCQSPNIKICAASRPWNAFQNEFSGQAQGTIILQDLTRHDIAQFVRGKLQPHVVHARVSEANVEHLVEEVTRRAEGVFLWVSLVVKELTKSLNNCDSFFNVCRRLEGIPTDLEAFFRRKVNNIEDFYWQQSARTFLVCMHADGPLKLIGLAALEESDTLADKICDKAGRVSETECEEIYGFLQKRINGCCQDLLETYRPDDSLASVNFLHRTVRDFFLQDADVRLMLERRAGPDFNPHMSLCKIQAVLIHRLYDICNGEVGSLVQEVCMIESLRLAKYARQMESQQQEPPYHALASLHQILWTDSNHFYLDRGYDVNAWFFHLCAQECLLSFLAQYMLDEASTFKEVSAKTPGWVVWCLLQPRISRDGEEPETDSFDLDLDLASYYRPGRTLETLTIQGPAPRNFATILQRMDPEQRNNEYDRLLEYLSFGQSADEHDVASWMTTALIEAGARPGPSMAAGEKALLMSAFGAVETQRTLSLRPVPSIRQWLESFTMTIFARGQ